MPQESLPVFAQDCLPILLVVTNFQLADQEIRNILEREASGGNMDFPADGGLRVLQQSAMDVWIRRLIRAISLPLEGDYLPS